MILADGLKPKDLVGQPWRVAFALQRDGWYLRKDIVWAKAISFCPTYTGSCMPESCRDRPTSSHEYLFILTKSERYFYDIEGAREPATTDPAALKARVEAAKRAKSNHGPMVAAVEKWGTCEAYGPSTRNLRSVWAINPEAYPGPHYATFPTKLVEPCIRGGTSERGCCPACGAPWTRVVEKKRSFESGSGRSGNLPSGKHGAGLQGGGETLDVRRGPTVEARTVGCKPSCDCEAGEPIPCTVLDPFAGSGTVGEVAAKLGRNAILIDLKPDDAQERLGKAVPLLAPVEAE